MRHVLAALVEAQEEEVSGRRFIRGIPVRQVRDTEQTERVWVISVAEDLGRDPTRCTHGTRVKGIAVWANDDLRRKHGVPPGERACVFLPNPDEGMGWCQCSLCGSLRNPDGVWVEATTIKERE